MCDYVDPPKQPTWRIKIGGQYVRLGNKRKTVWYGRRAASAALTCHLKYSVVRKILNISGPIRYCDVDDGAIDKTWREFLSWALESRFIEFVPSE